MTNIMERQQSHERFGRDYITEWDRFLDPTKPVLGDAEYYDERLPLISKELSVAVIERRDMPSYMMKVRVAMELLRYELEDLARSVMISLLSELKLSMSIDGNVINNIVANRIEYTQNQNITERMVREKKPGFFNRKEG